MHCLTQRFKQFILLFVFTYQPLKNFSINVFWNFFITSGSIWEWPSTLRQTLHCHVKMELLFFSFSSLWRKTISWHYRSLTFIRFHGKFLSPKTETNAGKGCTYRKTYNSEDLCNDPTIPVWTWMYVLLDHDNRNWTDVLILLFGHVMNENNVWRRRKIHNHLGPSLLKENCPRAYWLIKLQLRIYPFSPNKMGNSVYLSDQELNDLHNPLDNWLGDWVTTAALVLQPLRCWPLRHQAVLAKQLIADDGAGHRGQTCCKGKSNI